MVYVESGEGATSEGEFFEALNWASRERLPVLFRRTEQRLRDQRSAEIANPFIGSKHRRRVRRECR